MSITPSSKSAGRPPRFDERHRPRRIGHYQRRMDHMKYCGNTIEAIAEQKAGIIKEGVPVVTTLMGRFEGHRPQGL